MPPYHVRGVYIVAIFDTNGTHYCSEYREVIDPMEFDDGNRPFPKGGSPTKSKDVRVLTVYYCVYREIFVVKIFPYLVCYTKI